METEAKKLTVDATYIIEGGSSFAYQSPWPHENLVSLKWQHPDEEIVIEFVYFGTHNNRIVYHALTIEENSNYFH